jgi:hypothetical protein
LSRAFFKRPLIRAAIREEEKNREFSSGMSGAGGIESFLKKNKNVEKSRKGLLLLTSG